MTTVTTATKVSARSSPEPREAQGLATRRALAAHLPCAGDRVLGGKYRIEGVLGAGGMGVVMAAEHVGLGRKVALKFLVPGQGVEFARFAREARAAARIESEHVARVNDVGALESGVAYMVMERLEGEDVGAHARRASPLPVAEAVHYALQACDAIAAAHAAHVIHRDLKPSNLFLARCADGTRLIKVLDFGISKLAEGGDDAVNLTRTGAFLGSPRYMSPEQARNPKAVDARTDVWGLGAVLYELLAGAPMFDVEPLPALCMAVVNEPAPPLRARRPDAPAELEAIVLRCAEKDPARRFPSAVDLALALAPFAPPEAAPLVAQIARRGGLALTPASARVALSRRAQLDATESAIAPVAASTKSGAVARRKPELALWVVAAMALAGGGGFAWRVSQGPAQARHALNRALRSVPWPSAPRATALMTPPLAKAPAPSAPSSPAAAPASEAAPPPAAAPAPEAAPPSSTPAAPLVSPSATAEAPAHPTRKPRPSIRPPTSDDELNDAAVIYRR